MRSSILQTFLRQIRLFLTCAQRRGSERLGCRLQDEGAAQQGVHGGRVQWRMERAMKVYTNERN